MKHPDAIFVQLTTGCNAACISCPHPFTYGKDGTHPAGNMSEDVWGLLLAQIKGADYRGQVGLYLHHEPLLVKDLARKIKEVNSKTRAFVVLSTNGALLTPIRRRELIEAGPRTVHVNMSSADPRQYEDIMKLPWAPTFENVRAFLRESRATIKVEINVPRLPEVDVSLFYRMFPGAHVNVESWANSRGGLLPDVSAKDRGSRFKGKSYCKQPEQNFNVLHDGSVVVCCMDWSHQSKASFPKITEENLFSIYNCERMNAIRREFRQGDYSRFAMCGPCSEEMNFDRTN